MELDNNLDNSERFLKNVQYYRNVILNKDDKEFLTISTKILEDILDELLLNKILTYSKNVEIPNISFDSKIELTYKARIFHTALRDSLKLLSFISTHFYSSNCNFNDDQVLKEVLLLCEINNNQMFNLLLELISKDYRIDKEYLKLEDLIVDIGVDNLLKFIISIIYASLLEILVESK